MTPDDGKPDDRAALAAVIHDETRALIGELLACHSVDSLFAAIDPGRFHTILGVALAHAALWRYERDPAHRTAALELTARYLRERGQPASRPRLIARVRTNARWNSREAIEAGSTLGWILLALRPSLSSAESDTLSEPLRLTHRTLRAAGAFDAYINGNYAIPLCELVYLWRHIGATSDDALYEHCWRMLVQPGALAPRWAGYGWVATSLAADDGWLDAEGYFTETPGYVGPSPHDTFDPEYSQLQLERLARLWLLTGDARAMRHLRAIHRLLLRLLDREQWTIGSSAGSRTTGTTRFFSPASCLIALHSPQSEITAEFALEQFRHGIVADYRLHRLAPSPYLLRGYGTTLMPLLLMSASARAQWTAPVPSIAEQDVLSARKPIRRSGRRATSLCLSGQPATTTSSATT